MTVMSYCDKMSVSWLFRSPSRKLKTRNEESGNCSCSWVAICRMWTLYTSSSRTSVEKQLSKTTYRERKNVSNIITQRNENKHTALVKAPYHKPSLWSLKGHQAVSDRKTCGTAPFLHGLKEAQNATLWLTDRWFCVVGKIPISQLRIAATELNWKALSTQCFFHRKLQSRTVMLEDVYCGSRLDLC